MTDDERQRAMLVILLATCEQTIDTLRAANNPVDEQLLADLEAMAARTRRELADFGTPS